MLPCWDFGISLFFVSFVYDCKEHPFRVFCRVEVIWLCWFPFETQLQHPWSSILTSSLNSNLILVKESMDQFVFHERVSMVDRTVLGCLQMMMNWMTEVEFLLGSFPRAYYKISLSTRGSSSLQIVEVSCHWDSYKRDQVILLDSNSQMMMEYCLRGSCEKSWVR